MRSQINQMLIRIKQLFLQKYVIATPTVGACFDNLWEKTFYFSPTFCPLDSYALTLKI